MKLAYRWRTVWRSALLIVTASLLLFSEGCGGGSDESNSSPPIVTSPSQASFVLTGQVMSNGSGIDNIPVLVAPNEGQSSSGYARTVTSGGGQFSVQIPWSSVVVVAGNDQLAGAIEVSTTSNSAKPKVIAHADIAAQVPVQDVTQYAIPDPPSNFPPGDFSDNVASVRPHSVPAFLPLFEEFLKHSFGLAASSHFIERMLERAISMDEVTNAIENGQVFYDPKNDSLVYYANQIGVAVTPDFTVIKTVIRGPIQSGWQLIEEDAPPIIEGLARPRSHAYDHATLNRSH